MKNMKRISAFLMALIMLVGVSATVLAADSSVTYEGGAEKYVFFPGSEYTDTDLFDNFKGIMPGDTRTEVIKVENNSSASDYVKIYMRAVAHDGDNPLSEEVAVAEDIASMKEFLSILTMTVKQGDKEIYKASPDELAGLEENVLLGTFEKGESTELIVELTAPLETMDNRYANRVGEVDWVFVAEEGNYPSPSPEETPDTGDHSNIALYAGAAALAGCGIIIMNAKRKKEEK